MYIKQIESFSHAGALSQKIDFSTIITVVISRSDFVLPFCIPPIISYIIGRLHNE